MGKKRIVIEGTIMSVEPIELEEIEEKRCACGLKECICSTMNDDKPKETLEQDIRKDMVNHYIESRGYVSLDRVLEVFDRECSFGASILPVHIGSLRIALENLKDDNADVSI